MTIPVIVFIAFIMIFTIAHRLQVDPVWLTMLIAAGSVASYLMMQAPVHISWWIVGKIYGG